MTTINVQRVGLATIQDAGRRGLQSIGVPVAGAFDSERYRLACALIQERATPVVELLTGNLNLVPDADIAFAVVGPAAVAIGANMHAPGTVGLAPANSLLSVNALGGGPVYLAIPGLQSAQVLGSASYDSMSRLGPAPLRAGDRLEVADQLNTKLLGNCLRPEPETHLSSGVLRCIPGPHLPAATLEGQKYTVTGVARSGIRLSAGPTTAPTSATLPSLPVLPGVIQVPPDGNPIVLGPDSGVTGGYPIAGVVITADLSRMPRLSVGQEIRFHAVTVADAERVSAARELWIGHAVLGFSEVYRTGYQAGPTASD